MRHIYALAKRVIVWLGSGAEEAAKALKTLLELGVNIRPEPTPWDVAKYGRHESNPWDVAGSGRPEPNPWDIASNTEVVSKLRYWNRLWIIQELIAGKEIRLWCDVMDMYRGQFQSLYDMGSSYYSTPRLSDLCKFVSKGMRHGSLLQMIAHFSTSSCTDLRDRVYGFLDISCNADGFHVNYNETCTQLFFRVLEYSLTDLSP